MSCCCKLHAISNEIKTTPTFVKSLEPGTINYIVMFTEASPGNRHSLFKSGGKGLRERKVYIRQ